MTMKHHKHSRRNTRRGGFALVVVMLLCALLVAMLVALVSMTLLESRVVRTTAKLHLARANALVGLQKAVGTLQTYAGRDRCYTIPATISDDTVANPWLYAVAQKGTMTDPNADVTGIAWLTSGSSIDPSEDVPEVTPKTKVPMPSKQESRTVWMVRHSVNDDDKLSVAAAKVGISSDKIPLAQRVKKDVRIGSYAWWASDESLKARANLRTQLTGWSGDTADRENAWRLAAAPRAASWAMDDLKTMPQDDARSDRVLAFEQLPLLKKGSSLAKDVASHFHDLTTDSLGVLSDAYRGGLRRDLTLAFETGDTDFEADAVFGKPTNGIAGDGGINSRYVNWRTMRDFYRAFRNIDDQTLPAQTYTSITDKNASPQDKADATNLFLQSQNVLVPLAPEANEDADKYSPRKASFVPRVTRLEHAISMITQDAPDGKEGEGTLKLVLVIDPVVTMWNPYNIKLKAEAIRIDDSMPDLHVVIELRQPWNQDKQYRPPEEVWYENKIYQAKMPNKNKAPPGQNGEWEEQQRDWSLGSNLSLSQLLQRHKSDGAHYILTIDGAQEGKPEPMVFDAGEFAIFSMIKRTNGEGRLAPAMKRSWNPDAGMELDRLSLRPAQGQQGGQPGSQFWLRVYDDTELRVTIEPYRQTTKNYEDADPFEFKKHYKDEFQTNDGESQGQYSEQLGEFVGGDNPLDSFAWSQTRRGNFTHASYDTRAYHGKDQGDPKKPLPGMSDNMKVSTHLGKNKTYFALSDWHWKAESDVDFPAQSIERFNPAFELNLPPPSVDKKSGYPCAVPHFQVKFSRITSDKEIIETDRSFRGFWGPSYTAQGQQQAAVYEVPTAPLLSLGQLQHFQTSLSPYDTGYGIGSSWPSPFIERKSNVMVTGDDATLALYDSSWFLNDQLFDSYFFSSICSYGKNEGVSSRLGAITAEKGPKLLPNARLRLHTPPGTTRKAVAQSLGIVAGTTSKLTGYNKAAAFLFIDGPFNVNSTSVDAWKAVLAGCDDLKVPMHPGGLMGPSDNIFSRLTVTNGDAKDRWKGYRSLTADELQSLAEEIVLQVKARGPFRSLAEFVNRSLTDEDEGLSGPLQAAIDKTKINAHLKVQVTEAALQHAAAQHDEGQNEWAFPFPLHAVGPAMASQAGFLQQGDLLQALAPVLTVRGDTFKVRTYGEVLNPATGAIEARAWCEAVVQRMPEYVDHVNEESSSSGNGDPPWAVQKLDTDASTAVDTDKRPGVKSERNTRLGRIYRVVRLRWLSPDEV